MDLKIQAQTEKQKEIEAHNKKEAEGRFNPRFIPHYSQAKKRRLARRVK